MIRSFLFLICTFGTCSMAASEDVLEQRIPSHNKRYATFKYALELMQKRGARMLVETGTARCGASYCAEEGCSTVLFAHHAAIHGCKLYSVDISISALQRAMAAVKPYSRFVELVHHDSVAFLRDFPSVIDFLYLDSYDFDFNDPAPSQQHHLKEIIAAYPHLSQESIVMIDDCDLPFGGKGKLAIEYLLERGWKIAAQGYQVILIQN